MYIVKEKRKILNNIFLFIHDDYNMPEFTISAILNGWTY